MLNLDGGIFQQVDSQLPDNVEIFRHMTGAARIIFPDRHVHCLFSKMHYIPDFDANLYALALLG